jgi:hypothetical protein
MERLNFDLRFSERTLQTSPLHSSGVRLFSSSDLVKREASIRATHVNDDVGIAKSLSEHHSSLTLHLTSLAHFTT